MAKDFTWDSAAAIEIEQRELDQHFEGRREHYCGLVSHIKGKLDEIGQRPEYLKDDDVYQALYELITRDSTLLAEMQGKKLPQPSGRGGARWYSWFTHYIIEQCKEVDDA